MNHTWSRCLNICHSFLQPDLIYNRLVFQFHGIACTLKRIDQLKSTSSYTIHVYLYWLCICYCPSYSVDLELLASIYYINANRCVNHGSPTSTKEVQIMTFLDKAWYKPLTIGQEAITHIKWSIFILRLYRVCGDWLLNNKKLQSPDKDVDSTRPCGTRICAY